GLSANGGRLPSPIAAFSYACSTARTISSGAGSWVTRSRRMPSSKPSSAGFPRSRHRTERRAALAWRPSRWLLAGLVLLTVAAVFSLVASGLPGWLAVPGMLLAAGHGLALVLREARRPCRRFVFRATGEASVDGRRAQ